MRQPEFGGQRWGPGFRLHWSWTMTLVAAYVVVFLAQQTAEHFGRFDLLGYFMLSTQGLAHGYVWQLVTYQFMHGGWLHLILNCWAIVVFGSVVERLLGAPRYLALTLSSGIVGGVFQMVVAMVWPGYFGGPVVGASACAFGMVAAFAMMLTEQELTMLIFFVIPVRMRARTLLLVSLVIALMGVIFPNLLSLGNVANAAHLGGMAMGWFYIKKIVRNRVVLGVVEEEPAYRAEPAPPPKLPAEEFEDADVDMVLDKISARGIHSLTSRERAILEAARKRMARR